MKNAYSVGQVNAYIKNMFAQDFMLHNICVKGEVSNCKYHSSGHIYFTLKDEKGAMSAVMFAGNRRGLQFSMREGDKVLVTGSIEVYERDGRYQLYAREIKKDGEGDLFQQFERLKRELEEMGMFAPEYKKPIPKYIHRLGVVTAPTGAAVQDIRNISTRRNPYVQIILFPAKVQGEGAAESVVQGIQTLDAMGVDIIIVGRGGGSIEDLWAFNEEIVARAIFECETPVISAVGHETDVTIADFVADLRAPTPSAGAELAVFDFRELDETMQQYKIQLSRTMQYKIECMQRISENYKHRLQVKSPSYQINDRRQYALSLEEHMSHLICQSITKSKYELGVLASKLDGLSPAKQLSQGLAFVTDDKDKRISSVSQINKEDRIKLRLIDGTIISKVEEVKTM